MIENRYGQYLPAAVESLWEFEKLGEIESPILQEAAEAKEKLIQNQWILTAEREGLLRFAKMIPLQNAEKMETEVLRQEVLYRWNCHSPYTQFHLLDWLDGCCGTDGYQAFLYQEEYRLRLLLELREKEKKSFLEKHLRKIIPANLVLQVDLNTNTHGKLKRMTHGKMKKLDWTYGQIPFEDLIPFQIEE